MLAKIISCVNLGLNAYPIEVEIDVKERGLPSLTIVGLPDKAVEESKERVRAAIVNSGLKFPPRRKIVINLAPADIKKEGAIYDFPIAVGILHASDQLPVNSFDEKSIFVGELALNGDLRRTRGILPMAILAKEKNRAIYLPFANLNEAKLVKGLKIYPIKSLSQLITHLTGRQPLQPIISQGIDIPRLMDFAVDMAFIKGQEHAKRALEIAAAGGHNVLMTGPPGCGKTILAHAFPSILPPMTEEEILEVSKIYSVIGLLPTEQSLIYRRPYRDPHHTISDIALIGGGQYARPGEISLAHRGVLFLDELPEFPRRVLECLRQPLEDGQVTISRAKQTVTYPASFTLIASQNPCPCGWLCDPERTCTCSPGEIIRYRRKISGPLLDRIDIHLTIPRVKFDKLIDEQVAESSAKIRQRVKKARQKQLIRFRHHKKIFSNTEMNVADIKKYCLLEQTSVGLLKKAVEEWQLSVRAYYRILKVARTIADLSSQDKILTEHIAEAIQYRSRLQEKNY
ncbi:MAG: YifB family Mg chelatase-like AAA ATPase [Candidatus Aenigmarchaeota archaeon]|nr:YifB family Mg chelatase-like AAA ATPase [Candidatus Aenigmarchaeota archaeon]